MLLFLFGLLCLFFFGLYCIIRWLPRLFLLLICCEFCVFALVTCLLGLLGLAKRGGRIACGLLILCFDCGFQDLLGFWVWLDSVAWVWFSTPLGLVLGFLVFGFSNCGGCVFG